MGEHLISCNDLTVYEIEKLLSIAQYFETKQQGLPNISSVFRDKFIANLFLEPSTRTRFSFEVAEKKLGANVLNFQSGASSIQKGETLYDTLKTFESLGIDVAVIRLSEENTLEKLKGAINVKIINAGEGRIAHPTQALLDLYTIRKYFSTIKGLKVAIIGDIAHSRVARSNINVLKKFGANIILSGPSNLIPDDLHEEYLPIDEAIAQANVVMMLRIQFERQTISLVDSVEEYNQKYGLTKKRLAYLHPDAIILHPAPVNRGVEMDDVVVEHAQSKIFEQIANGVFVRMAVIERALGGEDIGYYH